MKIILLTILTSLTIIGYGQLDFTGIISNQSREASFTPTGHIFTDYYFIDEHEEFSNQLSPSNLWFSGFDPDNGYIHSGETFYSFNPNFTSGFISGPILNDTNLALSNASNYFDRVWIISDEDFNSFKENFTSGNLSIQDIPKDILEWPASNNPHFSIGAENGNILTQELAPFFDTNGDGNYNALEGDLPLFKTELPFESFNDVYAPDVFAFSVYNDTRFGNSDDFNMEICQSVYLFNCADDKDLNNTIFTNFSIKYKGNKTINDFKLAFWEDADVTCLNHHIGFNKTLNSGYAYSDNYDLSTCTAFNSDDFNINYGVTKNTLFLDKDVNSFLVYYSESVGTPDLNMIEPSNPLEHHNYMSGKWLDGTVMTKGGNGFNPGSIDSTNIAFPDLPTDSNGWSMLNAGIPPSDPRSVTSLNVPETLVPGQSFNIDIANTILLDRTLNYFDIFNDSEERLRSIKTFYQNLMTDPGFINSCEQDICIDNCVWPGDAIPDNIVNAKDLLYLGAYKGKNWITGPDRITETTIWRPVNAVSWNNNLLFTNGKNADCDGNGIIDSVDFFTVQKNFFKTTPDYIPTENRPSFKDSKNGYNIKISKTEIDATESIGARAFYFSVRPNLDGESFDLPYHGISFDVVFDSTLVSLSAAGCTINDDFFDMTAYANSFFDNKGTEGFQLEQRGNNRISIVLTSEKGEDQFPNQEIVTACNMFVRNDATTTNSDGRDTIQFSIENSFLIDKDGIPLDNIGYYCNELIITGVPFLSSTKNIKEQSKISIFPNPIYDEVQVKTDISHSGTFHIFDLNGKKIFAEATSNLKSNTLHLDKLKAGIYFLSIQNNKNEALGIKKLIVVK